MNIIAEILKKLKREQPTLQPEEIKDVVLCSEKELKVFLRTKKDVSTEQKESIVKTIKECRDEGLDFYGIEINLMLSPDLPYLNLMLEQINKRVLIVII